MVDEEGKHRTNVEIHGPTPNRSDLGRGHFGDNLTVDAHGRFRIEGLVPGIRYDAYGDSPSQAHGPILNGVQVGPGEVKDMGDITLPARKESGN